MMSDPQCIDPPTELLYDDDAEMLLKPNELFLMENLGSADYALADQPKPKPPGHLAYSLNFLLSLKAQNHELPEGFPEDLKSILSSSAPGTPEKFISAQDARRSQSLPRSRQKNWNRESPAVHSRSRSPGTALRSGRSRSKNGRKGAKSAKGKKKKGGNSQSEFDNLTLDDLHKSEDKWQATKADDEKGQAQKSIRLILNQLSAENFSTMLKKTLEIRITSFETLSAVAKIVFNKAIEEPNFCALYSKYVAQLSEKLPAFEDEKGNSRDFRWILLTRCHRYLVQEPVHTMLLIQQYHYGSINPPLIYQLSGVFDINI